MAVERIWDLQGFSGGESDDITRGPANSFYAGENIEVRKNMSGVQLSPSMVDVGWTISGTICYMENLSKFGLSGIIVCTESGNIYLDGVLKQTIATGTSAWNRIVGMGTIFVSGTQYLYYVTQTSFGQGKIHRSDKLLTSFDISTTGGAWDKSFQTEPGSNTCTILLAENGGLNIAINNCIINLSVIEYVTNILTLAKNEDIRGFTRFQSDYKIYANVGDNGIQYIWDGAEVLPSYRQVWGGQRILSIVNNGAYDYAILGYNENYSDLYLISGTQKQEIRVNLEASSSSRIFTGYLSIREDIIYISGGKSGESSKDGIYTYGNYFPGTPKSLVQSYSSLNSSRFTFHCHSIASSYFASTNGKVYTIEHNNPPSVLSPSGYVVTHMYEGNVWEEKAFKKMKVGFFLNIGDSIKIYARKNYGYDSDFVLIKTISHSQYGSKKGLTIHKNEINTIFNGNFFSLQLKAEILHSYGTYAGEQTNVKRITTFMDVVNQD